MTRYPIPAAALAAHLAILGKTRSGKSSTLRLLVEGELDRQRPVCIVDPKGDWWGLKSSADGRKAGYPVVIFGGEHADIPLNPHAGAAVAELFATGNRPCIIDLGGWTVGERTRFFIDFASALFRQTRGPRLLVIDEVHNFAPQGKIMDPEAGKMLHWANRLASEGAGKGITLFAASQRPQKVHKDFITCCETLIAMRVIHPLDRGAIKEWIDGCEDPANGKAVLASLAGMPRGEGWVWSPEIGFGPQRVAFPKFSTYDSFAAPTGETVERLAGWASVDLDEIRARLDTVVKQAEASDPRKLQARIRELEKQLTAAQKAGGASQVDLRAAAHTAFDEGHTAGYAKGFSAACLDAAADVDHLASKYRSWALQHVPGGNAAPISLGVVVEGSRPKPTPAKPIRPKAEAAPARRAVSADLKGPHTKILDAIAWWEAVGIDRPSRVQVAAVAGYSPKGGAFQNPLGFLRTKGFIEYPSGGEVCLTDAGRAAATSPGSPPTEAELHARIMDILDGPRRKILQPLLDAYPSALSREALAAAAGYEPRGGAFQNPLGALRSLGLIDYPAAGQVVALPILFIER